MSHDFANQDTTFEKVLRGGISLETSLKKYLQIEAGEAMSKLAGLAVWQHPSLSIANLTKNT